MAFYRKAMWFYRGWKDYTQEGFLDAEKKFNPGDLDVDLTGKSYMITGEPKCVKNKFISSLVSHIFFKILVH